MIGQQDGEAVGIGDAHRRDSQLLQRMVARVPRMHGDLVPLQLFDGLGRIRQVFGHEHSGDDARVDATSDTNSRSLVLY
jgi:hypothetical protein